MEALALNRPEIRYAWCGPAVLVTDNRGRAGTESLTGFFFRETRHLSDLRLEVQGEEPFPCSVAVTGPHEIEHSFVYPPVESQGGGGSGSGGQGERRGVPYRGLDLDVRHRVRPSSFEVVARLTSRWRDVDVRVGWLVGADFAGLSEVQAGSRKQEAPVLTEADGSGGVRFRYGHEGLPLETTVRAEGGRDWRFEASKPIDAGAGDGDPDAAGRLSGTVTLRRQETVEIRLVVRAHDADAPIDGAGEDRRMERLEAWHAGVARLHAPAETPLIGIVNDAMHELGALALLEGEDDEWLTPCAGMPLYPATFGRDALTASWQAAVFDRGELIRDTLARLRRLQGTERDDRRDELPGRIIQQARKDPVSRLGMNPFDRYYADYASPLMFIIGLGQLYAWSGEKRDVEANWEAARRILDWTREHGDLDGDGYLEYKTRSEKGPKHQGWKDSDNAVVDENGVQVDPPIAPCEIQGYWHAALQFMAGLSLVMGEVESARALWKEAADLKERFNRDFWLDDEGYIAFGLGPDKRPLRVLTSNAAQCIPTGIVAEENLPRLVRRIFEPDLFSGWGIRTLSTQNPAYNPLSYHLGSVWPVENGTILFGLRRYGFDERALQLSQAVYDLARGWSGGRIPECVGGYARGERGHPGAYPRANVPQAWNRSTFAILVQSLLGLRGLAALHLLAVDPVLPPWLPEITVKHLRVGEATATLRFWRDDDGESHFDVVERSGTLHVVRQPPVNSLTAGVRDRVGALLTDVLPF